MQVQNPVMESSIKVAVRVRPLFDHEKRLVKNKQRTNVIVCDKNVVSLLDPNEGKVGKFERAFDNFSFTFDSVFGPTTDNEEVVYILFMYLNDFIFFLFRYI
jgi:hypothetical protein